VRPKTLLVIEDDQTIAELLAYNLRHAGYEVLCAHDGHAGLTAALSYDIDLAIVDLMLPELDGLSVSSEIARQKPGLPIIILTARTAREDMLAGFATGADDYVTKPFDLDELLARVAARLRRVESDSAAPEAPVAFGGLMLDPDTHTLTTSSGEVYLKPREYGLLEMLMSQPGHLFRREEIMHRVWQQQYTQSSRTLDVHVRHLRMKLEQVAAPIGIQNLRGVGYRIALREDGGR
jgi:two-component system alkaline phosphatase synthesis response regulator PhoP